MKFIIKNIKRAMLLHWRLNFLILVDLVLCTAIIFVMMQNFVFANNIQDAFFSGNQAAERYVFEIQNDDIEALMNDVENKTPMYDIAKTVREEIFASPNFLAYTSNPCSVNLSDISNPEDFPEDLVYFDYDGETPYIDGYIYSENAAEAFNLHVSEGRLLTSSDFNNLDISQPVSVLLGSDFQSVFQLGDVVLTCGDDAAVVVGFLEPNSFIAEYGSNNPNTFPLDKSIIYPLFFPRNTEYLSAEYHERMALLSLDCSYLVVSDPTIDVQSEMNKITAKYGFYPIEVFPLDGTAISNAKIISEKNVALLLMLGIVSTVICLIALSSVLYKRTLKDRATFCIYLTSGIPLWKINVSLLLEMSFWLILSILPSISISIIEYGRLYVPLWQILLYSGTIMMVSLAPVFVIIGKSNLDLMIRNQMD